MYKSAFLGCGGRARAHAQAYAKITRGKIVAICDLDEERLNAFGNEYGVEHCYTNIHQYFRHGNPPHSMGWEEMPFLLFSCDVAVNKIQ